MANVVPHSFKSELLSGTHNFATGGDSFKLALYTAGSGSPYAATATAYSSGVAMKLVLVEVVDTLLAERH